MKQTREINVKRTLNEQKIEGDALMGPPLWHLGGGPRPLPRGQGGGHGVLPLIMQGGDYRVTPLGLFLLTKGLTTVYTHPKHE